MEFFKLAYNFQLTPSNESTINRMKLIREEVIHRWGQLGLLNGLDDIIPVQPLGMPILRGVLFYMDFVYDVSEMAKKEFFRPIMTAKLSTNGLKYD